MAKKKQGSKPKVHSPPLKSLQSPSSPTIFVPSTFALPYHLKHPSPPPEPEKNPSSNKREMRNRNRKRNVAREFERYFGEDTKLENWQRLCRDVGIEDYLPSLRRCKMALKTVWINIYDLLDAVDAGSCPPHRFASQKELREYTLMEWKIFPKKKAKEGGPVRALLAHIFH